MILFGRLRIAASVRLSAEELADILKVSRYEMSGCLHKCLKALQVLI